MMNVIFAGIILFSFVFAALTGRMPQLSEAAMGQAGEAVTLVPVSYTHLMAASAYCWATVSGTVNIAL